MLSETNEHAESTSFLEELQQVFDPMSPKATVYRVASKWSLCDFESGQLLPTAFRMKQEDFEKGDGLSVIVHEHCPSSDEVYDLTGRSSTRAVGALGVGAIRELDLGLDVVQDTEFHAGIRGLPYTDDENDLVTLQKVDDCAEALAEISTICSGTPKVPIE